MGKGTKTYIYGLYRVEGEIFYVGKSVSPKLRMTTHADYYGRGITMIIIDIFYDRESYWINELKKQNHPIENKQILRYDGEYEINDIITIKPKNPVINIESRNPIKVKYGDKIYKNPNHLYTSGDIPLSLYYIRSILNNPSHHLYKNFPIEYVK